MYDKHIVIGKDRRIKVPDELKRIAVQYDHNIETVTFDCPRYWDGHDMSKMTVYINYLRADRGRGQFEAKNVVVDDYDPDLMHFDWIISRNASLVKGKLVFLVCIVKTDEIGEEEHHWNSELCEDIYVSEGLECSEAITTGYADVITDLLVRMDNIILADAAILDTSLSERGLAADARATGYAIGELNRDVLAIQSELSKDISAETAARKAEIATERARINKLASLNVGSTTGDAELMDIRVGHNGALYSSAGHAVRDQINELYETSDFLASELGLAKPLTCEFANMGNGTDGHLIADSIYRGAFVKVKPGQVLRVRAGGYFNRFSFAFCNSMEHGAESMSVATNSFTDKSERYAEKVVIVPDGYSLMFVTLYVEGTDFPMNSFSCDLSICDITTSSMDNRPAIFHPEVTDIGAVDGLLTKKLVKGFFIQVKPNTTYKVAIRGEHNRCYYYGADEMIIGKAGTAIDNLRFIEVRNLTEVTFNSQDYNYVVFTIAYTGEGFEPNCEIDVYENYGNPITVNGIEVQAEQEVVKPVSFYKANRNVENVGTTADIYAMYDALVDTYPDYVSKNTIGSNSLGVDIREYIFTQNSDYNACTTNQRDKDDVFKRDTILIVSGVHGYERSAVMSTYSFAKDLCEKAANLEAVREKFCIKIIPVATPYSFDNDSRTNENGVNIARNFNIEWKLTSPDSQDYGGEAVANQAETQVIQQWIESNTHALLLIDHHNSGYEHEVSYLAGNATVMDAEDLKKKLFGSTDSLTGYWKDEIGIVNPYTIYAYTGFSGGFASLAAAYNYATKNGVQGVCLETSWNQNGDFGMHSKETIGVGAEVLGNLIRQFIE